MRVSGGIDSDADAARIWTYFWSFRELGMYLMSSSCHHPPRPPPHLVSAPFIQTSLCSQKYRHFPTLKTWHFLGALIPQMLDGYTFLSASLSLPTYGNHEQCPAHHLFPSDYITLPNIFSSVPFAYGVFPQTDSRHLIWGPFSGNHRSPRVWNHLQELIQHVIAQLNFCFTQEPRLLPLSALILLVGKD